MTYLTDSQIGEMADAAFTTYDVACCWKAATRAAAEYAVDELGVKPRKSAVLLAVKIAKLRWSAASFAVKQLITNN